MKALFCLVAFVVAVFAITWTVAFVICTANAYWNCVTWEASTGDKTQVIAASCYVKSGAHWELFDTYIRRHHLDVEAAP